MINVNSFLYQFILFSTIAIPGVEAKDQPLQKSCFVVAFIFKNIIKTSF